MRPLIAGCEELAAGTEGPAWGWVKDSASSSSSSAWLFVSLRVRTEGYVHTLADSLLVFGRMTLYAEVYG